MVDISFSSQLSSQFRDEVESLLFFHPRQDSMAPSILRSVTAYGVPEVVEQGGKIRIQLGDGRVCQSLFASDNETGELTAIAIYTIEAGSLILVHLAIREKYSSFGNHAQAVVALQIFRRICESAACIKGIHSVTVMYGTHKAQRIPVSKPKPCLV